MENNNGVVDNGGFIFGIAFIFLFICFHRLYVKIAGGIIGLFNDDKEKIQKAMELFLFIQ